MKKLFLKIKSLTFWDIPHSDKSNYKYLTYFLILFLVSICIIDLNLAKEGNTNLELNGVSPATFTASKNLSYTNVTEYERTKKSLEDSKIIYYKYIFDSEKLIRDQMSGFRKKTYEVLEIKNKSKPSDLYVNLKEYADKNDTDNNLIVAISNESDNLGYENLSILEKKIIGFMSSGDGISESNLEDTKSEMKMFIQSVFRNPIIQDYFIQNIINKVTPSKVADDEKTNIVLDQKISQAKSKNSEDIKKGQKIIDKGEILTQREIDIINIFELNSNKSNLIKYLKLNGLVFFLIFGLYALIHKIPKLYENKNKVHLLIMLFVIGLTLIIISINLGIDYSDALIFTPLIVILIDICISKRLAIFVNIIYAVIIGYLINDISIMMVYLLIGLVISLLLSKVKNRSDLTKISLYSSVVSLCIMYLVDVYNSYHYYIYLLIYLNITISFFLSTHILSIIEKRFKVITPFTLMELQQHKILEELTLKAPGTMIHSTNIANLAKNAAFKIGADTVLCYTSALFHDIGKLSDPIMFTENHYHFNIKTNPHNTISPLESAKIIKKHIEYGVQLANSIGLPNEIKQIIKTHHGDSVIKYFYNKAVEDAKEKGEQTPDINDFRYTWGKPKTKEEGILMLCDIAEAVSKSFDNTDRDYLEEKIPIYLNSVVEDGELDDCELTLKEIKIIQDSIVDTLVNINLRRTKYQNQKD